MTERPSASIIVLAWNAWQHTRTCLESLRPTLGLHDEVIVVDNGSTDATFDGLRRAGWTKVITNEENRGFAAGCNQGAAIATGEVVVFLNNDTVPVGKWLDELLAPFGDESVAATGARSNFVSGPQLIPGNLYQNRSELRAFERRWRMGHAGQTEESNRLVGFCLAVRRSALQAITGFDEAYGIGGYEDDDLCRRLRQAGGRLLIAQGAYMHHVGHVSFDANGLNWQQIELENRGYFLGSDHEGPLISACIIARDEEDVLGRCIDSLTGLADEVVVGDTGSNDATAEVATAHGARVVSVPWTDHFAEARNATLEHCRGQWILWIDADEEWVGDTAAVRSHLETDPAEDGALVTITNFMGQGVAATMSHPAVRLFRRGLRWEGRLHEQIVRTDGRATIAPLLEDAGLVHHGYTDRAMADRNKLERNLRLAAAALEEVDGPIDRAAAQLNLGRTLIAIGRPGEAIQHLEAASASPMPITARMALHVAVRAAISASDLSRAADRIADLRRLSVNPLLPDLLTAEMAYHARMYCEALELFERIDLPARDEDAFLHEPAEVAHIIAACHRALGEPGRALEVLLGSLRQAGVCQEHLGTLTHDARVAGVPLHLIGEALPTRSMRLFLAQLLHIDPEDALGVLEGVWERHVDDLAVLAAAATVAAASPPQAALPWSARLRERGLSPCPLLAIAADLERPSIDRLLAAGAARSGFKDDTADRLIRELIPGITAAELEEARTILQTLAPDLVAILPQPTPATLRSTPRARLASIIVPCWNRAHWTLRLLQSLQATLEAGSYELVLVDNGSSDATRRITSNPDAGVVVVRNEAHRGLAVACNQGAEAATSDVVVFCHNDVVAKPGWLPPLLSALEDRRVGIVGPKLVFPDGTIQHAGIGLLYDADGEGYLDGFNLLYRQPQSHPASARARELRAVTGAAMAVRRDVFLDLGGFDSGYHNGKQDIDLCLTFGRHGWLVRYEPASVLVHQESVAGSEPPREVSRNRARLTARWTGQVLDERVDTGVAVAAPFGRGDAADVLGRALVALAEEAGVPVVSRAWASQTSTSAQPQPWPHRLGPPQPLVLSTLDSTDLAGWLEADRDWLAENAKVIEGVEELIACGLVEGPMEGEGCPSISAEAADILQHLAGGHKRSTYSSWRVARADSEADPRTGQST